MKSQAIGRHFPVLLCITGNLCLSGCASLYLHDAATQKQTDSAAAALTSLKIDPIFASESSYLDGLEKAETTEVLAKYAAQRDHDILLILDGTGPGGDDGFTTLRGRIDGYLVGLVGVSDSGCDRKLWRAVDFDPSKQWGTTKEMTALSQSITAKINAIKDPANCPPAKAPRTITALASVSPSATLDGAAQVVLGDLKSISDLQTTAAGAKTELDAALASVKTQMAGGKPLAADVSKDLATLSTALNSANPLIKQYASAALSAQIATTIEALAPSSDDKATSGLGAEERSGVAVMQALFKVGDAYASPPRVPHPNALAAAQSWLNYVGSQAATQLANQQVQLKDHQAQFAAVLTTVYYLSKAGEAIQGVTDDRIKRLKGTEGVAVLLDAKDAPSSRAATAAVISYASAWTHGFAADAAASRLTYIDQRRADLATGRAAATAWLGTLKPAVDTLSSYGSGGFDPQIIVQLIQALGVAGVAVGVNK